MLLYYWWQALKDRGLPPFPSARATTPSFSLNPLTSDRSSLYIHSSSKERPISTEIFSYSRLTYFSSSERSHLLLPTLQVRPPRCSSVLMRLRPLMTRPLSSSCPILLL